MRLNAGYGKVIVCLCAAIVAREGLACGNVLYVQFNPVIHEAMHSSRLLDHGDYSQAVSAITEAFPELLSQSAAAFIPQQAHAAPKRAPRPRPYREIVRTPPDPGALARAERTLALAVLRTDGKALSAAERKQFGAHDNVMRWAVHVLMTAPRQPYAEKNPSLDAQWSAARAEAMSRTADGQVEAALVLEHLAADDLLGDPVTWAALASLRQRRGDAEGAVAARQQCELLAADAKLCRAYQDKKAALVFIQTRGRP